MMQVRTVYLWGVAIVVALFAGAAVGQSSGGVASLQTRTADAVSMVRLSQQPLLHISSGVLLGLGIGVLIGSVSMYAHWNRKL